MTLPLLDTVIIVGYLLLTLVAGIAFAGKAKRSVDDFFVTGRSLPWWLAGASMIASSYSIDTPLGITGFVADHGISGVWFAWSYVIGGAGMLGAFIFASLLRRSRIITTAEIIEVRYSGRSAAGLRLFKGIYFGIISNCLVMAWVIKAVDTFAQSTLGWSGTSTVFIICAITLVYAALSGMWGIAATDTIQLILSTIGTVTLAWLAMDAVGGVEGLTKGLEGRFGVEESAKRLSFLPEVGTDFFWTFLVFVTLKWWGNPPAAISQRIVSTKDERHASFATLLFTSVTFAINYWPMIVIALVSLVLYPTLVGGQAEHGYAMMVRDLMPTGLLGLMLAALLAAFMSTIDTHLNLGASFIVNDIYRRFMVKGASDKHYVLAARASTVLMLILALVVAQNLASVNSVWKYLAAMSAGYGVVAIIRWFWWRVNAAAEIAALLASGVSTQVVYLLLKEQSFGLKFLIIFLISTVCWVVVAYTTKPTDMERLIHFCRLVRPFPRFWGPVVQAAPDIEWDRTILPSLIRWLVGIVAVYSLCFGLGSLILDRSLDALVMITLAVVCSLFLWWSLANREKGTVGGQERAVADSGATKG